MSKPLKLELVLLGLVLQGCAAFGPKVDEEIIGRWQSSVGGFPIEIAYSATTVTVGNNPPVAYKINGDQLTFAEGGSQVRIVSFSGSTMTQLDPITGTEHQFVRMSQAKQP